MLSGAQKLFAAVLGVAALLIVPFAQAAAAEPEPEPLPYREIVAPANGRTPVGAMLLIHGGGWLQGEGGVIVMREAAQRYADQGWLVWNIDHRSGQNAFPDVQMWFRTLAAEVEGPICASGGSSGGHLALLLAAHEEVDCVISEGGPTDLTTLDDTVDEYAAAAFGDSRWENSPLRFARER